jgi:3-isopropylmalate dehydratase small subunit
VLNQSRYAGSASISLARAHGCGSCRPERWTSLTRAIIAPSYADIFFNNSSERPAAHRARAHEAQLVTEMAAPVCNTIDLGMVIVKIRARNCLSTFRLSRKYCLLSGWRHQPDPVAEHDKIQKAFEAERLAAKPWLESCSLQFKRK